MNSSDVLARLTGVRAAGKGWKARCPAHEDVVASLSIGNGEGGRVLLCCHAGCDARQIVAAMGLTMADVMGDAPATAPRLDRAPRVPPPVAGLDDGRPPGSPGLGCGVNDTPQAFAAAVRATCAPARMAAVAAAHEPIVRAEVRAFLRDAIKHGMPLDRGWLHQVAQAYGRADEEVCAWAHSLIDPDENQTAEDRLAGYANWLIVHHAVTERAVLRALLQQAPPAAAVSTVTLGAIVEAAISGAW